MCSRANLGPTGVDNTPDYVENETLLKEYIHTVKIKADSPYLTHQ